MTRSEGGEANSRSTPSWVPIAIFAAVVPPLVLVVLAIVQLATVYDPTLIWDITDAQAAAALIALSGFVGGVLVGLIARMRGLSLLIPGFTAGLVGGLFGLGLAVFDLSGSWRDGFFWASIWLAVSAAVFLSTRLTGYALVGSIAAIVGLGVGGGALVASIPEPPAELVLILQNYEDDETGEGCKGYVEKLSGEATEVGEGTLLYLHEAPTVSGETFSVVSEVVLGQGQPSPSGCVFELGDPLGLPVLEYAEISIAPESGEWSESVTVTLEENRMVTRVEN